MRDIEEARDTTSFINGDGIPVRIDARGHVWYGCSTLPALNDGRRA